MTKIDLLHGFEAMYQSLDCKLRDPILGVTFSLNNHDEKAWHSELEQFWKQWMCVTLMICHRPSQPADARAARWMSSTNRA
ncbi:type VI secretion protein IcmF/TssM N-terminal domain-containing protein [Xenorhabdus entomophaga]|uniref:type VI secretion protein IcmF/TssM N-terminal domain-containing protein n=1 Tax=Xenorhabdus entomophaga TaxID=3136257 RepID=UPI0030F43FD6